MATTSSLPKSKLLVEGSDGSSLRFNLVDESMWREDLVPSTEGCVIENGEYSFAIQTSLDVAADVLRLFVNGEEVARGAARAQRIEICEAEYVYPLEVILAQKPFSLIVGYARAELEVRAEAGTRYAASRDIPVLTRGDREIEEERIALMFSALFDSDIDGALSWMLTGTPAEGRRFSIVDGGAVSLSPKGFSTFLQLAERVLAGFDECLPMFRQRAASRVVRSVTRINRKRVTRVGAREAMWIARNPQVLERVNDNSCISDGKSGYLPRYVQAERRTKTYDLYENEAVVAFLDYVARQLLRLSMLLDEHLEHERDVLRALSPFARDGYVFSSLLVTSVAVQRRAQVQAALGRLAQKARRLKEAYLRVVPGVTVIPFRPPRRSKLFQEVDPYIRLYHLIHAWCAFGELDISREGLALRIERMDTFYELYVLHEFLRALRSAGFVVDGNPEEAIRCVRYSNVGQFAASEKPVANRYLLKRGSTRLQLFYEPVFSADASEQHGVNIHRVTRSAGGANAPYTPDFLIRVSEVGGPWQDFVFDAKYRYVAGTVGVPDRELGLPGGRSLMVTEQMDCLVKYKLGCIASDTGLAPRAVWLLCGRDADEAWSTFEGSLWFVANAGGLAPSGSASVSPKANLMERVLRAVGVLRDGGGAD